MLEEYSPDEMMVMVVAAVTALVSWGSWYYALSAVGRRVRTQGNRSGLALTPLLCALLLYVVLGRWSSEDVRTDPAYMLFYMIAGAAWLGLYRTALPFLGLSVRDDALERGNGAAAWAVSGALAGGTCCFAGANVGNGPGWWVVLFSGVLSTTGLFFLWRALHACTGLAEKVVVDRDVAAALRAAGFWVGCGLILGRAVAGDWVSAGATVVDFGRTAWLALVLAGAVAVVERSQGPDLPLSPGAVCISGCVPAAVYITAGVVVVLLW